MAIKLTKNELKTQKDKLKQFERYLPTLQLKKQQLQSVIMQVVSELQLTEKDRTENIFTLKHVLRGFQTQMLRVNRRDILCALQKIRQMAQHVLRRLRR